jgi:UDP-N-acetylmuramoyl-tripeptide--D-alanyl-D-alanine ligase
MKGALELLSKATTRKVAILGDMFELGENEKQLHYEVGTFASTLTLDQIICIGSLANHIYKGYLDAGFSNILHFPTKDDFFEEIDKLLSLNDTILLKASNGMAFSQIVDIIKER